MSLGKIVLLVYGFLLIAGAFMGLKAGSKVSLIMGLVSGAMVLIAYYLLRTNIQLGYGLAIAVSGFLTVTFAIRFMKTLKIMPAGMLLVLSLVVLCVSIASLLAVLKK